MEPIALGDLQLLPWEFGRLTPREFRLRVTGYRRALEDRWLELATLGTWVLAPHLKRGQELSAEGLLGWPKNWRAARVRERRAEAQGETGNGDADVRPAGPGPGARRRRR